MAASPAKKEGIFFKDLFAPLQLHLENPQRVGELLKIFRTAEVGLMAGVLQLDPVAAIEVIDEVRKARALLNRDLLRGGVQ